MLPKFCNYEAGKSPKDIAVILLLEASQRTFLEELALIITTEMSTAVYIRTSAERIEARARGENAMAGNIAARAAKIINRRGKMGG